MTVAAPTLFWYQLGTGTYAPDYFAQLDTAVRALCAANSVTAPAATPTNQISGSYVSAWLAQTDVAVRALSTALSENNYTTFVNNHSTFVDTDLEDVSGGASFYDIHGALTLDMNWHNVIFSGDVSGGGVAKCFVDGTDVTSLNASGNLPFTMVFNGKSFWFANDSFGTVITGDIADVWIAPNVSLLVGNTIPSVNLLLFRGADGKPQNPSGFPASAILFSGDASTFGTNQGSGGAFTTTGALTNAATSPST